VGGTDREYVRDQPTLILGNRETTWARKLVTHCALVSSSAAWGRTQQWREAWGLLEGEGRGLGRLLPGKATGLIKTSGIRGELS